MLSLDSRDLTKVCWVVGPPCLCLLAFCSFTPLLTFVEFRPLTFLLSASILQHTPLHVHPHQAVARELHILDCSLSLDLAAHMRLISDRLVARWKARARPAATNAAYSSAKEAGEDFIDGSGTLPT